MWRRPEIFLAFFPALLVLVFAGWAGTFAGAARGLWPVLGHGLLLVGVMIAGRSLGDPLGLGRSGGLLLAALLGSVAASWVLSPVPRAGLLGLLLLPAFLFLPRAVEVCWATPERRRVGVLALSAGVGAVAAGSLVAASFEGGPAALPLGHHNLLAAWLLTLLPVAVVPWKYGGGARLLAALSGALGLVALAATRSLAAALTAGLLASVLAVRKRRGRLALAAAALLLLPQVPRLATLASSDSSLRARLGYLEAGWRGFLERPVVGWGPGATAWTVSEHLRPVPGVHPPGEFLADLHALPLQLAYELGTSGVLLLAGVVAVFLGRRRAELAAGGDRGLAGAASVGMAAFAVVSCGGLPLSVTALPVALAVVAGALWSASRGAGGAPGPAAGAAGRPRTAGWTRRLAAAAAVALSAVFAIPLHLGRAAYDRAVLQEGLAEQARHLRRAVELDPAFPLYRARLAWLDRELAAGPEAGPARRALRAADDAYAVAPLWLVAGVLGQEARQAWSRGALIRACRLDPLGALAPYRLATGGGARPRAPEWGARALLSDPDLLAAPWDGRYDLLAAAVEWAAAVEGVDAGWRLRLRETFEEGLRYSGEARRKGLELDADPATSLSLHAFRRTPWPAELVPVEVDPGALGQLDLVSMARQPSTAREVLAWRPDCALADD